ncbi:MAG: type II toxin-antitoxin system HipA family toxin YjjJ [Dokdonella sp.]
MDDARAQRLEGLLRQRGSLSARELAPELGITQSTLSRLLTSIGARVVRIGRARATRYALANEIARAGSRWPLYRIDANGRPQTIGELRALQRDEFHLEAAHALPSFMHGDFASGLYPGLPWFLDDQRPQGFLGRTFARSVAKDIDAPEDPLRWQTDDVVLGLLRHGEDRPGDLVLGETSLQRALQAIVSPAATIAVDARNVRYPQLAAASLQAEDVGSSVAGEQPKFAITLQYPDHYEPVIVKFSDRITTPAGRRWADLLTSEHHAGVTLGDHGIPAARTELVEADQRVFLQSTRFDRTSVLGRRGVVSLASLDAAFYGHGRIDWWRFAQQLQRDGWLTNENARNLSLCSWFGTLIANVDMHLGNASLYLADERPLALSPSYDMLPMRFRPSVSGEIVERRYEITMPTPEHKADWLDAARMAQVFWRRVGDDARISVEFRAIAADAQAVLARALVHMSA